MKKRNAATLMMSNYWADNIRKLQDSSTLSVPATQDGTPNIRETWGTTYVDVPEAKNNDIEDLMIQT